MHLVLGIFVFLLLIVAAVVLIVVSLAVTMVRGIGRVLFGNPRRRGAEQVSSAVAPTCSVCRQVNPPLARFCRKCGRPLAMAARVRRVA